VSKVADFSKVAEYIITRYVAPHDKNGNPRRVWVVVPTTGEFRCWWFAYDEGYAGRHAMPDAVRGAEEDGVVLRFPDVKVSATEYKRILKEGETGVMV
jgi:hypothetical protein